MVAVTACSDFGAQENVTASIVSPSVCHEVMGPDAMSSVFWMLSFKPTFSLSCTFIKRLFSSCSLSVIGWCHQHIWSDKWKSLSHVWFFVTPWNIESMDFSIDYGMGSLTLLQGIFLTQGSNPGLLHCRQILYQPSHKGIPAYLTLLIFLLAILIPGCNSSSLAFLMMYFAYKLNKQGDNILTWCDPFSILNQSVDLCLVLLFILSMLLLLLLSRFSHVWLYVTP